MRSSRLATQRASSSDSDATETAVCGAAVAETASNMTAIDESEVCIQSSYRKIHESASANRAETMLLRIA